MTIPPSASGSQGLGPRANWKRKLRFLQSVFRGSPIRSIRRRLMSRSSERKLTAVTTTVDRPPRLTLQNLAVSKIQMNYSVRPDSNSRPLYDRPADILVGNEALPS